MSEIDQIKRLVSLAQLVGTHEKRISCPLPGHNDESPSCDLDHDENLWHCKACDIGGDIFSLLMHRDRKTFREALQELAEVAGVELGRKGPEFEKERDRQESIIIIRPY
jgi:DNA primase